MRTYIPCTCHKAYTSRGMKAPDCPMCAFAEGVWKDIEAALDAGEIEGYMKASHAELLKKTSTAPYNVLDRFRTNVRNLQTHPTAEREHGINSRHVIVDKDVLDSLKELVGDV